MNHFALFQGLPKIIVKTCLLCCLLVACSRVTATEIDWTGAVSTNWMVAGNWSGNTIPGPEDIVRISDVVNDPVITGGSATAVKLVFISFGGKLTIQAGAILQLTTSAVYGIQNHGELKNAGFLNMASPDLYTIYGILNYSPGTFTNEASGIISVAGAEDSCIDNLGTFRNAGIIQAGISNNFSAYGLKNSGSFINLETGLITLDFSEYAALSNGVGAQFDNYGSILIGNPGGSELEGKAVENTGLFRNVGCKSFLKVATDNIIEGNYPSYGVFINEGSIIDNASGNSLITTNTGVVQNLNGGAFTITNNSGYLTQNDERIWKGCEDNSWANPGNWHGGSTNVTGLPLVLMPGPFQPTIQGLVQIQSLLVRPGAALSVTSNALLEVTGPGVHGIFSEGTINNSGQIKIGTIGTFSMAGFDNQGNFSNRAGSELTINKTAVFALRNNYSDTLTNAGIIRIGNMGATGLGGFFNYGKYENGPSGEMYIDRVSATGISNQDEFRNTGNIRLGQLGAAGVHSIDNAGVFSNSGLIESFPGSMTESEIRHLSYSFTNERCGAIILKKRILLQDPFFNQGLLRMGAAATAVNNDVLTNTGIIEYGAGNYIPNTVNNGIIVRAMPEGQCNVFSNALEVGNLNGFVVNASWYRNAPMNQLAGTYAPASNTLTTIGIPSGIAGNYYFTIADPECSKTYTFQTSGTMPVDVVAPQVVCPPNQSIQLPGTYTIASPVSDNCPDLTYWSATFSGNTNGNPVDFPAITYGYDPGPIVFQAGVTTVTLGATDGSNSAQTCSFTVTAAASLPLELSDFKGQILPDGNHLKWTTATEKNVAWHILERSADGLHWTEMVRQQGQLHSTSPEHYEAFDPSPYLRSYYRLRSTDLDGSAQVSSIIQLERKGLGGHIEAVYPVPFDDQLTVQFGSEREQTFQCRVLDATGRVVAEQTFTAVKGTGQLLTFELGYLLSGVYWIVLESEEGREVLGVLKR